MRIIVVVVVVVVSGRLWEAQPDVFCVCGRFWKVQPVVFYVFGRLWEVDSIVFYVVLKLRGGRMSNGGKLPGGDPIRGPEKHLSPPCNVAFLF